MFFFASKETYQIAKSNQIKYQIRFLKMTSHQIILIYINLMHMYGICWILPTCICLHGLLVLFKAAFGEFG